MYVVHSQNWQGKNVNIFSSPKLSLDVSQNTTTITPLPAPKMWEFGIWDSFGLRNKSKVNNPLPRKYGNLGFRHFWTQQQKLGQPPPPPKKIIWDFGIFWPQQQKLGQSPPPPPPQMWGFGLKAILNSVKKRVRSTPLPHETWGFRQSWTRQNKS